MILQLGMSFQMANIIHAASGKIIEEHDAIAAVEQALGEMRSDEAGAAGD